MNTRESQGDRLVEDYLKRLDHALRNAPASRRREVVDEVRGHIAAARAELSPEAGEAGIRTILDRVGNPDEIAREAGAPTAGRARPGLMEIGALILLPIGGVVLPLVGWLAGVALLWASPLWTRRDKLIGTVLLPGGLLAPFYLAGAPATVTTSATRCFIHGAHQACTSSGTAPAASLLGLGAFLTLFLLPLITTIYLSFRLRHAPDTLLAV